MTIEFPSKPKEIEQRAKTDVQRELSESNPFLKNSFLGAIITGYSLRVFDFYTQLQELIKQLFVQTATGEFLVMFGEWFGITRISATSATGTVVATGTASSIIPSATLFQSSDGLQYESTAQAVITDVLITIASITRSGSLVTVTSTNAHNLASLIDVTISGADQSEYNGTFAVTVTGLTTFTYDIVGTPVTPATGTIMAAFTTANISLKSIDFGQSVNQLAGTTITFVSPVAGVDSNTTVDFSEISGGTNIEDDPDFRTRVIDRVQNPVALFNIPAITNKAKEVAGVTRVFVFEITPDVGQVTIYFVRDNDANIIPSAGEVATTKDKILEIKPANTADDDVIVLAPTEVSVDFTFSAINPSTPTMQDAITTSLNEVFKITELGVDVTEDSYRSAIFQTTDRETGDRLQSFSLTTPTADITIAAGEIATLGTITFN